MVSMIGSTTSSRRNTVIVSKKLATPEGTTVALRKALQQADQNCIRNPHDHHVTRDRQVNFDPDVDGRELGQFDFSSQEMVWIDKGQLQVIMVENVPNYINLRGGTISRFVRLRPFNFVRLTFEGV